MIIYLENYKAIVEQTENRLMEAAEKDALTKMHNRGNMQERLNYILEQKKKFGTIMNYINQLGNLIFFLV